MPAWMAGIQVRRMRPETSMSAWIPALHAGMTESRSRTETDPGPPPLVFSKEDAKITKFKMIDLRNLSGACPESGRRVRFVVRMLFAQWRLDSMKFVFGVLFLVCQRH